MNKRPAEQWYTGDWYRAVDVQKCCPATRGIWRDALDAMTNEQITGKIRGTREQICRLLRCNDKELQRFVDDNKLHRFANVTFCHGKVTIICRRLYRVYLEREGTKKRVRKYRKSKKQEGNADVTSYSSSSTSSSSSKKKKEKDKESFLKFVFLSKEEHQKLVALYGEQNIKSLMRDLNNYIGSTGKRYKSHYFTLLNWAKRNETPVICKSQPPPEEKPIIPATPEQMAEIRKKAMEKGLLKTPIHKRINTRNEAQKQIKKLGVRL